MMEAVHMVYLLLVLFILLLYYKGFSAVVSDVGNVLLMIIYKLQGR